MAWIDNVCSYRPETGTVVNEGEIVYVKMEITNNFPWDLTKIKYELTNVGGQAKLEPETDSVPKQVIGADIPPGSTAIQEFTLKATTAGNGDATMTLLWELANTGLTYPVSCNVSFPILQAQG